LGQELEQLLSNAQSGIGLSQAFTELGEQAQVPVLARFADAVSIAMERGTPMAEIMRAQAADIRDVGRRTLMESAGRKEIAMMIPVVFLVLPVTVVFAVFPGLIGLSMNG
jgi:tight adherence protein C